MNWISWALSAALALAAADVFVKLAAGKIPSSLGMLLYGGVAFSIGLVWYVSERVRGVSHAIGAGGVVSGLMVGVTFSLVTFAMYAAFRVGAPLSVVSPLVRLGGLLVAAIVGVLLWREPVNARYVLGVILSPVGILLILTR